MFQVVSLLVLFLYLQILFLYPLLPGFHLFSRRKLLKRVDWYWNHNWGCWSLLINVQYLRITIKRDCLTSYGNHVCLWLSFKFSNVLENGVELSALNSVLLCVTFLFLPRNLLPLALTVSELLDLVLKMLCFSSIYLFILWRWNFKYLSFNKKVLAQYQKLL